MLKNIFSSVLATLLLQTGVLFSTVGSTLTFSTALARTFYGAAFLMGLRVPYGIIQVNKLDKYLERYGTKR